MRYSILPVSLFALVISATASHAFFDEVVALKQELQLWETTHAADFSEIVAQFEDITAPVFHDVGHKDWFNPYVLSLSEWGIVSGYRNSEGQPTGEFKPSNSVTIAEVLKMALEAARVDETACPKDVLHSQARAGHWAAAYVSCSEDMNMRIFRTGEIDLNRVARRAEVLSIAHDAFKDDVLPLYSNFRDTAGHPYEADIAYAALLGVVSGDTDGNGNPKGIFRPDEQINRAETAKVIYEKIKESVRSETL